MNWMFIAFLITVAFALWLVSYRIRWYRSELALQQACLDCAILWGSVIVCTEPTTTDEIREAVFERIKATKIDRLMSEYGDAVSLQEVQDMYQMTEQHFRKTTSCIHQSIEAHKNASKAVAVHH